MLHRNISRFTVLLLLITALAIPAGAQQQTRVSDIPDKFIRNYTVVERGYNLSDTIETAFFQLTDFASGSIEMPESKVDELVQFINNGKNRLFVLRGETDNGRWGRKEKGRFVRYTMDVNSLLNLVLGNGRADEVAGKIIDGGQFVDVIYAPVSDAERGVGIWSLPLDTKFGAYPVALPDSIKALRTENASLREQNKKTDGRVDSLANALRQYDQDHGYFGMIISFGLEGALASGSLNDPYGLNVAMQLKSSETFGVKAVVVANRMGKGHGGLGGRLEFIIDRIVLGGGYHVYSDYTFSPAWTQHDKNIPLYVGCQIPLTGIGVPGIVLTPFAGAQLNMDFGDKKFDGKWAINRTDFMVGVRGELINIKLGDVK